MLESFFVVWHYVGMMDSDIQWQVRAWLRTESREFVCYDHFLTWEVMDCDSNIPVGITSCIVAMQECLLGSFWRWIQVACGLI